MDITLIIAIFSTLFFAVMCLISLIKMKKDIKNTNYQDLKKEYEKTHQEREHILEEIANKYDPKRKDD